MPKMENDYFNEIDLTALDAFDESVELEFIAMEVYLSNPIAAERFFKENEHMFSTPWNGPSTFYEMYLEAKNNAK